MGKSLILVAVGAMLTGCALGPRHTVPPEADDVIASSSPLPVAAAKRRNWITVGSTFVEADRVSVVEIREDGTTGAFLRQSPVGDDDAPEVQARDPGGLPRELAAAGWIPLKRATDAGGVAGQSVRWVNPAAIITVDLVDTPQGDAARVWVEAGPGRTSVVGLAYGESRAAVLRLVGGE